MPPKKLDVVEACAQFGSLTEQQQSTELASGSRNALIWVGVKLGLPIASGMSKSSIATSIVHRLKAHAHPESGRTSGGNEARLERSIRRGGAFQAALVALACASTFGVVGRAWRCGTRGVQQWAAAERAGVSGLKRG
jgi:hypothetical protein